MGSIVPQSGLSVRCIKDSSRLDVLGEDFGLVEDDQKQARERFDRITTAYEAIKKQRGIK